jgi:hypothetical protein
MQSVTGIFTFFEQARQSAEDLRANGISKENVNFLTPDASAAKINSIPSTEGEQPGMGKAVGGVVGAALGTAAGAPLGMAVATAIIPGVGPAIAIGLAASALLGVGGAIGGAAAGGSLEDALTEGLPKDEILVYEDALKQGRTVMIVFTESEKQASGVREILKRHGAESVDAAREQWWWACATRKKNTIPGKGKISVRMRKNTGSVLNRRCCCARAVTRMRKYPNI